MYRPDEVRRGAHWNSVVTQQQKCRIIYTTAGNQRQQRIAKLLPSSGVIMDGSGGSNGGRTKPWTNAYELSHDLKAKQVEVLEKKYGGRWRSRNAATVIQRAYRQYCLTRNFAKLRWEADERRLSRRFAEFGHSKTVWSDLASAVDSPNPGGDVDIMTCSDYDNVMTHSYSSDNMLHHFVAQRTLRTFRQMVLQPMEVLGAPAKDRGDCARGVEPNREVTETRKVVEIPVQHLSTKAAAAGGSYLRSHLELSDSGESVLNSPLEPAVDLPSECFESVLEKQVVDALDDSFTSDSDNDTSINDPTPERLRQSRIPDGGTGANSPSKPLNSSSDRPPDSAEAGDETTELSPDGSPVWKRKSRNLESLFSELGSSTSPSVPSSKSRTSPSKSRGAIGLATIADCVEPVRDAVEPKTRTPTGGSVAAISSNPSTESLDMKISDRTRKRAYRIGLNLFNKKPENGVRYLIVRRFLDHRPASVAKFLISRKGLSKQMVGEYLGNLQNSFNMEVLRCFANQIELSGLQVDVALRKFQSYFRMPGEAQKIERLMEAFATRYCQCNPEHREDFCTSETVFLLAFAIIMLNTDLHNSNIKPDRKMKVNDFIKNLRGIDGGQDINASILSGIYERIHICELKPGADHVSHVFRLEQMIFGNKPQLALPHRRLVCYCRMYEVIDPLKRDKVGQHQRELFLFNDVLMVTKLFNKKKKKTPSYSFRQMFSLFGMVVHMFESPFYKHGLRLSSNLGGNVLIMLNARNEHDRTKFVDDLKESMLEITEMEGLRIEEELKKQKFSQASSNFVRYSKDSGVVDIEMLKLAESSVNRLSAPECERLKKTTLSNSLNDITDHNRRGSGISLDSGVASAESESVGSCLEPNRSSRYLAPPLASSTSSSSSASHVS